MARLYLKTKRGARMKYKCKYNKQLKSHLCLGCGTPLRYANQDEAGGGFCCEMCMDNFYRQHPNAEVQE